jgi:hypothetical protein
MAPRLSALILIALACSCSTRKPLGEPAIAAAPATLIPDTGASLYLIESTTDWIDDSSHLVLTIDSPRGTVWIGETGLKFVLRHALSKKEIVFKAQGDFMITSGRPTEATLTDPDSIAAPPYIGFHVKLNASCGKRPGYVDLQWKARIVTTDRKGTETADEIAEGRSEAPLRATLVIPRLKEKDQYYFLLLRIASLEEP